MAEISMGSALAELESSLGAEADEASIGAVSVVLLDFSRECKGLIVISSSEIGWIE